MVTPMFECRLLPKDPNSSIKWIIVRIDDPINIIDTDVLLDFLEAQFPFYVIHTVLEGYKKVSEDESETIN